jgi:hypothetical protein
MRDTEEVKVGTEPAEGRMLFLFQHPLRRLLLTLYVDSDDPLSPKELADYTRKPLGIVAAHVRVLRDLGALRLVAVRPVRGAVEHFYAVTDLVDEVPWARAVLGSKGAA